MTVWPRVVSVRTGGTPQLGLDGGVELGQGEDVWHLVVTCLHYECQVIDQFLTSAGVNLNLQSYGQNTTMSWEGSVRGQ